MSNAKNYSKTLLIIIFIIAIFLRIYNDLNIPFHYDPGKNIVYERAVLDSFPLFPQYNEYFNLGEYYEYQVLFPYIVVLLYKITGISLVSLTAGSAIIIGSLMVITVYLLSKEIFNNEIAALISAGLIAIDKIQMFSYMNYYPQMTALMLIPLAFIFVIRYTRTLYKKYLVYISILSVLIILSSYLASIVYISILILTLIIYSITKKDLRYIYALILTIIGTTALTTFYILPIIDRHGVKLFIDGIINTVFTQKDISFTNAPTDIIILNMFGFIFFVILIICISLIICLIRKIPRLKSAKIDSKRIKYEYILLFVWILISLILTESHRFRPILWTDRYIEFFDTAMVILVGYSIYFIIENMSDKMSNDFGTNKKIILILILMTVFIYPIYDIIRHDYIFTHWDTPGDLKTLDYISKNFPSNTLFVAPPGVTSFWVSALGGIHVLGGESSQMLGEKFDGNAHSDTIINSPNINEKLDLIRRFGVQYIYLTFRPKSSSLWSNDYNDEGVKALRDPQYFEPIYRTGDRLSITYIIKVKENLTPKYNESKINNNITILGYIISMVALIMMMTVVMIEKKDRKKIKYKGN